MSLVSGPGRGGGEGSSNTPGGLVVDKHVKYIQSLDTVRTRRYRNAASHLRPLMILIA